MKELFLRILICLILITSCKSDPFDIDTSNINIDIEIKHFYKELVEEYYPGQQ